MLRALLERFRSRRQDVEKPKDPAAKERRQFPVHAMTVLLNLLSVTAWEWCGVTAPAAICYYTWGNVYAPSPLSPVDSVRILLSGPILQLCSGGVRDALIVRLPRKTFPTDHNPLRLCTADLVARILREYHTEKGLYPTLPRLLSSLGYQAESIISEVYWERQSFFCDLVSLSLEAADSPLAPSESFDQFVAKYNYRSSQLELKTRRYFSRGDERAFVVDSSIIRPLVGSILQSLFLPRVMSVRRQLETESVNPARGKNIIAHNFSVRVGTAVYVAVSDTSSFTSSGVNLWIALLGVLTALTARNLMELNCPFTVSIGGQYLTVTLESVIKLYLWTTVGVGCWSEDISAYYVSQGGYLGVSANITMCLLAQSLQLIAIQRLLERSLAYVRFQSGGDDIYSVLAGTDQDCSEGLTEIERSFNKYIGKQKEFSFVRLDTLSDGDHPMGLSFCKKELRVTRRSSGDTVTYDVYSVRDLPVMEVLLAPQPRSHKAREKEFKSFCASAKDAASSQQEPLLAYTSLVSLYHRVKEAPSLSLLDRSVKTVSLREDQLVRVGRTLYSEAAYRAMCAVKAVSTEGGTVLFTADEKTNFLFASDRVAMRRLEGTGPPELLPQVILTRREAAKAERKKGYDPLPVQETEPPGMDELVKWLGEYRSELGV